MLRALMHRSQKNNLTLTQIRHHGSKTVPAAVRLDWPVTQLTYSGSGRCALGHEDVSKEAVLFPSQNGLIPVHGLLYLNTLSCTARSIQGLVPWLLRPGELEAFWRFRVRNSEECVYVR